MVQLIDLFKETLPKVKLIGKRYIDSDRDQYGSFGQKWEEWFQNGYFTVLEKKITNHPYPDYLGVMRETESGFEYWIGMFFPESENDIAGFDAVMIEKSEMAVGYLYGNPDNGELYGMDPHMMVIKKIAEMGWVSANTWFIERYNCPRFTKKDDQGNVILDYCVFLKSTD